MVNVAIKLSYSLTCCIELSYTMTLRARISLRYRITLIFIVGAKIWDRYAAFATHFPSHLPGEERDEDPSL